MLEYSLISELESFCWKSGTTLSLNQLLSDPWKHCKDAQGRQGHVEVQLLSENHRKLPLCEVYVYIINILTFVPPPTTRLKYVALFLFRNFWMIIQNASLWVRTMSAPSRCRPFAFPFGKKLWY